jgi:DNA-binding response OmpR family regulator
MKILVVDDEKLLVKGIKFNLENEGYTVDACYDGESAVSMARSENYDLIILDLMMPKKDGLQACQEIRGFSTVPIIMLTARSEDADKLMGFESGADDYVTKPFNPVELIARVRSQLRRYLQLGGGAAQGDTMKLGGIEIDDRKKTVTRDGEPVSLTPREYDILKFLMQHPGEVFSPSELYRRVWNEEPYGAESTVAVHIRHLREKLEITPAQPRWIKAVWGQGYKLEN